MLIINSVVTLLNIDINVSKVTAANSEVRDIEQYIVEKYTDAHLIDISNKTKQILKKYNVKCSKISLDNELPALIFYVDKSTDDLEKELSKLTNIKCLVMVGEYDE